ncbi:MAG: type III-B CRISPR-associated protein Cas10/Cmr2 [Candidatus Binatia bacterium]
MTAHLVAIALGPVQDFIAAARRTRDLWFGSLLLSEISKAAARTVREAGGELIFPWPENPDSDLASGSDFNVANVILAKVPEGILPKKIATSAEIAAQDCWNRYAGCAYQAASRLIDKTIWDEQIGDVIEFYAAWTPLNQPYDQVRQRLMWLLAGRKFLRNFKQAKGWERVPKSSLDGARESVFKLWGTRQETRKERWEILSDDKRLAQRLRLSNGEELDIVGLTKRAALREAFPSVVRVAVDPWLRGIEANGGDAKKQLQAIAEETAKLMGYEGEQIPHSTGTGDWYKDTPFPYDGATLFPSRLDTFLRTKADSCAMEDLFNDDDRKTVQRIKKLLAGLQKGDSGYGEPEPYLAIIHADGDRMSKALAVIDDVVEHRKFSRQLARFAGRSRDIVKKYHGCLVYSGGDDVLAFAPVDHCLSCARQLYDAFRGLLDQWQNDEGKSPTLSVGIAIGHCLDPLEDLLEYTRAAEKAAKNPDREGLAVHLHPRSGPPICVRSQWDTNLDTRLAEWAEMHQKEKLPDKAAYDLRELAKDYAGWPVSEQTDEAVEKDIERLLSRKQIENKAFEKAMERSFAGQQVEDSPYDKYHTGAMRLAEEWLIARRIAKAMKQAQGKKAEPEESP